MVIQCPECSTRFKLSDDKIKPEGVKVRCTKCRHIFIVGPETAAETAPASGEPAEEQPAGSSFAAEPERTKPPAESETQASINDELWGTDFDEGNLNTFTAKGKPAAEDDWGLGFEASPDLSLGKGMPETSDSTADRPAGENDWSDILESEPVFEGIPSTISDTMKPSAEIEDGDIRLNEEDLALSPAEERSTETTEANPPPAENSEWSPSFDESDLGLSSLDDMPVETVSRDSDFRLDDQLAGEPPEEANLPSFVEPSDPTDLAWEEIPEEEITGDAFVFEDEAVDAESDAEFEFEEDSDVAENVHESENEDLSLDEFSFEEEPSPETEGDLPGFSFDESIDDEFSFESDSSNTEEAFAFDEDNLFASDHETPTAPENPVGLGIDLPQEKSAMRDNFGFAGISFGESESSSTIAVETQEDIAPVERIRPAKQSEIPPNSFADFTTALPSLLKQKRKSPMSSVLRIFLALLLVLGSIAGYLLWRGGTTDILQTINQLRNPQEPTALAGQIHLPLPNSFFIMNQEAGQLFVVQGEAVNGYPENRSAIAVKGMLHDDKGNVLMQQTVFCGNLLSYEELQTESFRRIEEAMTNQFGNALSNLNVGPDKAIPYMIVFRALPTNVTEYTVEVVDSKPGGQH